jgi:hypothetical protein
MATNHVVLNLPAHRGGNLPNPGQPLLTIDGVPIKDIIGVSVQVGECLPEVAKGMSMVTVMFYADIEGSLDVEEKIIPSLD